MTTELREAIARLRLAGRGDTYYGIEDDIKLICNALEAHLLNWTAEERETLKRGGSVDVVLNGTAFKARQAPAFDKTSYQREYMRKWRKVKKLFKVD
jgi:hypothetical protein